MMQFKSIRTPLCLTAQVFVTMIVVAGTCACSPAKRPADEPIDAGTDTDTETDTDTGSDTELVWNPGEDFNIAEPTILYEYQANNRPKPSIAFNGQNIAVSWSDGRTNSTNPPYFTFFIVFPWTEPFNHNIGMFTQEPPICDGNYSWNGAVSQPFPAPGGFLLLTSTIGHSNDGCQVVQSGWNLDADIVHGPFAHHDLYPREFYHVMSPTGPVDTEGRVTAGNLKCVNCDEPGLEELVYQIYRFSPGDFAEPLLQESYSWSSHAQETGKVFSGYGGFNTFEWNGVLTTVAYGKYGQVVLARGTAAGQVIQEPDILPIPLDYSEDSFPQIAYRSFAQRDGTLLVVITLLYQEYEDQNPFPVEMWSYVLSMDGDLLYGPTPLAAYDSHVYGDRPMATWSGQFFGLCYREPFDTFKFLLLDEDGQALNDPASLFWEIPPIENRLSPCNIIAIDDETFAVVMSVVSDGEQDYNDGMYITYIKVNPPE